MANMDKPEWQRPPTVPYPSVWSVVEGKKPMKNGVVPRFRIQDIPRGFEKDVLANLTGIFLRDEPTCSDLKITEDPEAVGEFTRLWEEVLKKRIAMVALLENAEEIDDPTLPLIAGLNMTVPKTPEEHEVEFKNEKVLHVLDMMNYLDKKVNCFQKYNVSVLMSAYGLHVHPVFRGQGLGEHLLRTRSILGKAVGITATTTVFSAEQVINAAANAGFELMAEYLVEDFNKNCGKEVFKGPNLTRMVLMGMPFL